MRNLAKRALVWLYCHRWISLETTDRAFAELGLRTKR